MFTVQAKIYDLWITQHIAEDMPEALRIASDTLNFLFDEVRIIDETGKVIVSDKEL